MLEDIDKSIKATLYDRLTSPLIGSYITAWCVFNYKIFLVIFSSLNYPEKINELENLFSWWGAYLLRYGIPFLWTVFYILWYPYIAQWGFRKWQEYVKAKEDIKNSVREKTCLTEEQSRKLRIEMAQKTLEFEKLTSDKTEDIKRLSEQNFKLSEHVNSLTEELRNVQEKYKNVTDRSEMRKKYTITFSDDGKLHCNSSNDGYGYFDICTKCFHSDPPKIIRLTYNDQCPLCNSSYNDMSSQDYIISVDNTWGCWINNKKKKICPTCFIKHGKSEYSQLALISDNELFCPLCERHFKKSNAGSTNHIDGKQMNN